MILFKLKSSEAIFPFEENALSRLARRWGVKEEQIEEAIMQTGSLKRKEVREYLAKKGMVFSFSGFFFLMKKRWKLFLDRINDEEQYA